MPVSSLLLLHLPSAVVFRHLAFALFALCELVNVLPELPLVAVVFAAVFRVALVTL